MNATAIRPLGVRHRRPSAARRQAAAGGDTASGEASGGGAAGDRLTAALRARAQARHRAVLDALGRIDEGAYGLSVGCRTAPRRREVITTRLNPHTTDTEVVTMRYLTLLAARPAPGRDRRTGRGAC